MIPAACLEWTHRNAVILGVWNGDLKLRRVKA